MNGALGRFCEVNCRMSENRDILRISISSRCLSRNQFCFRDSTMIQARKTFYVVSVCKAGHWLLKRVKRLIVINLSKCRLFLNNLLTQDLFNEKFSIHLPIRLIDDPCNGWSNFCLWKSHRLKCNSITNDENSKDEDKVFQVLQLRIKQAKITVAQ